MLITGSLLYDFLVFLGTVFVGIYLFFTRHSDYWKKRNIPYDKPTFFFGSMYDVFTAKKVIGKLFQDLYNEMKTPYLGIFLIDKPALLTSDLNLIKNILHQDFNNFVNRPFAHSKNTLGATMFSLMQNEEWKLYRRKLTPGFSKVKANFDLVQTIGDEYVAYLNKIADKKGVINVKHLGEYYGIEVITYLGIGAKADCFSNDDSFFAKMALKMFNLDNMVRAFSLSAYLMFPELVKLFKLNIMDPESEAFLYGLFAGSVENRQQGSYTFRNDFIDCLLKLQKEDKEINLDMSDMATQAITFWIGGYETTSILISTCLYELAKNPDKQDKLRNELNKAVKKTPDGRFTYEMVTGEIKYLEMVIKETLRKYPPLPIISRIPKENYPISGTNYVIEKGVPIFIPNYALQMDPNHFPNPEEFIPERFSHEDDIIPFTFMPFGQGPRMCPGEKIGMVMDSLGIALAVKNFEWKLNDESQKIMEFYTKATILSPKPEKTVLRFKKAAPQISVTTH